MDNILIGQELIEIYPTSVTETPIVSIIVQTYNHAPYVRECLDGILMQKTDFEYEILLGEDDSSDGTREICIEYANKYPNKIRLFLHNRKNVIYIDGHATGRYNFIYNLQNSKGKYIALCEGDDYWTDISKLQKQIDFLGANERYAGCFHDTGVLLSDGTTKLFRKHDKTELNVEDTISIIAPFHTSSFVFRKDALTIPNWFTKVASADMALFSIVSAKGLLKYIQDVVSIYRKHENGITNTTSHLHDAYHRNRIKLIKKLNRYHKFNYRKTCKKAIQYHTHEIKKDKPLYILKQKVNHKLKTLLTYKR